MDIMNINQPNLSNPRKTTTNEKQRKAKPQKHKQRKEKGKENGKKGKDENKPLCPNLRTSLLAPATANLGEEKNVLMAAFSISSANPLISVFLFLPRRRSSSGPSSVFESCGEGVCTPETL